MPRIVQPSVRETAFNCPHCGAFTTQHWYELDAEEITGDPPLPFVVRQEQKNGLINNREIPDAAKKEMLVWFETLEKGLVFIREKHESTWVKNGVDNLNL